METKYTQASNILNEKGEIEPGWSTQSIMRYERKQIKAMPWRIKEWDFYQVSDGEKCLQFTYGHSAYVGQVNCMLFNFKTGEKIAEVGRILPFVFGSLHLPEDAQADSDVCYEKKGIYLRFKVEGTTRFLTFEGGGLSASITLEQTIPHGLVIGVPFDEYPTAFYYNHKINCMTARGKVSYNGQEYNFDENAYGLLDWGRGVWPFHNEWYWSNGTGMVNGEMFGFNLGCGFGNTSYATENIVFYKGQAHKLGKVNIAVGTQYMKPWRITDEEGRLDLTLTPWYDRTTKAKVAFIDNECHQMFGEFTGTVVLDDGTKLAIKDVIAFAEHAVNNW